MPDSPWIMLLYSLPTGRGTARVAIWRKLKKSGALAHRASAYLLPNRPDLLERFQWLAQQVIDSGGEATVAFVSELEGVRQEEIVRQFNDARATEYAGVSKALKSVRQKPADVRLPELEKLRRQFQEIRRIDFFGTAEGEELRVLLERAGASNPQREPQGVLSPHQFSGKTWLTRPRPAIDRVGSAWLIREFIDPRATFVFGSDPAEHPHAIPYDIAGVDFTHHGDDCTFETLLKRFGIADPALKKLGEMIHDADLEDGKFHANEGLGLDRVFKGWAKLGLADEEIFSRGFKCMDALHEFLK